ncbi:hypothetical protein EDF64_106193 [Curtobacterium flaccumfaciens]|uniref:Uncharacterized protein n=1 Tax=Curtobacterium flaccumfaciens TaxID=2035 RepID=A0A4R6DIN6_9MICO|nr:hypothetical protein [Curtobacterium flaccumfaciens]TDN44019.1 hypothetical protein EDF64_106193 [Curtobacterium flaccumfaciens]
MNKQRILTTAIGTAVVAAATLGATTPAMAAATAPAATTSAAASSSTAADGCGFVITRSVSENADGSFTVAGTAKAGNRIEGRIEGTVVARTVATNGSYTFTVPATAAGQLLETFSILGSQSVSTSDRLLSQEQNGARVSSIVSLGGDRWRISVVSPGAATVVATPTGDDSIILDEDRKRPIENPTSEFTLDVTAKAGSSITLWSEVKFEYISTDFVVQAR